jgi:hypothetical protein
MVFRRNTLKNTKTFKQINKTSSGSSNINTLSTKQNIPTPQTSKHVSGSSSRSEEPKRQTYKTNSTKEWSLSSIFPEIVPPEVYADTGEESPIPESPVESQQYYDTNSALINSQKFTDKDGVYDMKSAAADSGSEKIHPVNKQPNWIDSVVTNFYNWRDENFSILPTSNKYEGNPATAEEDPSAVPSAVIPELKDEPFPKMESGPQSIGGAYNKDNKWVSAKSKEGSTISTIFDYGNNEFRTGSYNLPSNVSQSAHQAALDRQAMYKFENQIQSAYSTMLRESGPGNRLNEKNFLNLKSQINQSNISQSKKDDMISEYTNKITNYQKAAGGYGTSNPWSFGTKSSSNPNKAERLQNKLDSGGQLTEKERKYLAVVTGKNKAPQYDSIGMGQVPDYGEMFTPGVTDKVLKKKEQPIWFDYQDIGY